ncbi:MAG: formylglycine-generating enzyme family protein [Thermoguttaceae bacterium]|nr:formylglycine-generating enzyme family protein [Thermoguttaceae bacterium]
MSSRCFAYPMLAAAVLLAPESVRAGGDDLPALATAPFDAEKARRHQDVWSECLEKPVEVANSIGMEFVLIPAGEFMMGASDSERQLAKAQVDALGWREEVATASKESIDNEGPRHRVRITQPFYLCAYPVPQEAYEEVMEANPSWFSRDGRGSDQVLDQDTSRFPVERVRWKDAMEFCRRLSAIEAERSAGRDYRLPTEAEWEYACRAGTTSRYSFGDDPAELDRYGWHIGNSDKRTHRVGLKKPNAWGLYDMHGNVWELCADWYQSDYYANSPTDDPQGPASGTLRVARGGSWLLPALGSRTAIRLRDKPGQVGLDLGFRVVLVVPESGK